jgi:hypothetical protein
LKWGATTDLNYDNKRNGLNLGRLINSNLLLNTIVSNNKIFGRKAIDEVARLRLHQGGDQHDLRLGTENGCGRLRKG